MPLINLDITHSCIKIKDKRDAKNLVGDHLSRLEKPELAAIDETVIFEKFPDESLFSLFALHVDSPPWFTDIPNYLSLKSSRVI